MNPGNNTPRVLVVIAHHETLNDTLEALDSLAKVRGIKLKTVVMDNGSREQSEAAVIQRRFPVVTVIRSETNLGSAAGINSAVRFGLAHFDANYVLFLDSDVVVDPSFMASMLSTSMRLDSGITGAQTLSYKNKRESRGLGGRIIEFLGITLVVGASKDYVSSGHTSMELEWVPGTAMLVRRDVINKVGLLNASITGWEDIEYCLRARMSGFKVICEPRSLVWHKGAMTRRNKSRVRAKSEPVTGNDIRRYAEFFRTISSHPHISYITATLIGYPLSVLGHLMERDKSLRLYYHHRFLRTIGFPV